MKRTRDILFVAWLEVVKHEQFLKYVLTDEKRKLAEFEFNIDSKIWNEYKKGFYTSESTKTRYAIQRLKDLIN